MIYLPLIIFIEGCGVFVLDIFIKDWLVWVPTIETDSDYKSWAQDKISIVDDGSAPKVMAVPPAMRRRLGRLGKISLNIASKLVEKNGYMPSIFCSRHGEIQTTIQMLKELVWNDEISPTKFSLSVHNAISGIFTIANKDDLPTTAITAGAQDLINCFYEAYGQLKSGVAEQVLCMIYDEPIPEEYQHYCPLPSHPFAIGFVLSLSGINGIKCSLKSSQPEQEVNVSDLMTLEFVKNLILKNESIVLSSASAQDKQTWKVELEYS